MSQELVQEMIQLKKKDPLLNWITVIDGTL